MFISTNKEALALTKDLGVSQNDAIRRAAAAAAAAADDAAVRLERVLTNDPMMGIFRHVDAGYDLAKECARSHDVNIPMRDF